MNCYASRKECPELTGCPPGRTLCSDGSCQADVSLCPVQSCPIFLPIQCPDGFCVADSKYCDLSNGCPFDKPNKCMDGSCQKEKCTLTASCPDGQKPCLDGSCSPDRNSCPN